MAQNIVKKGNYVNESTTNHLLGLASDLCVNLPQAIGANSETTNACVAAKMGELGVIQERMKGAKPEEMPALIEQSDAAYRALSRKDIQNKVFWFAITGTICGSAARIAKYMCRAAATVA